MYENLDNLDNVDNLPPPPPAHGHHRGQFQLSVPGPAMAGLIGALSNPRFNLREIAPLIFAAAIGTSPDTMAGKMPAVPGADKMAIHGHRQECLCYATNTGISKPNVTGVVWAEIARCGLPRNPPPEKAGDAGANLSA